MRAPILLRWVPKTGEAASRRRSAATAPAHGRLCCRTAGSGPAPPQGAPPAVGAPASAPRSMGTPGQASRATRCSAAWWGPPASSCGPASPPPSSYVQPPARPSLRRGAGLSGEAGAKAHRSRGVRGRETQRSIRWQGPQERDRKKKRQRLRGPQGQARGSVQPLVHLWPVRLHALEEGGRGRGRPWERPGQVAGKGVT